MIRRLLDELSTPPEPWSRHARVAIPILAIAVAASRFLALARTPWEWDEILFALGLRQFDVTLHHPHPPGFPLYIFLAHLIRPVVASDFVALQTVVLIASLLLFPALLFMAREMRFSFPVAAGGSLLCCFFPNIWFFGGTAFSDVLSLMLVCLAVALLLRGCRSRSSLILGAVVLALASGVRPQNLLIGMIPALLASAAWLRRREVKTPLFGMVAGGLVLIGIYTGAALASASVQGYLATLSAHRQYILTQDSFLSPDRPPLLTVFGEFAFRHYSFFTLGHLVSLLVLVSIVASFRKRRLAVFLVASTFGPFLLMAILLLDRFSLTRFAIGYSPMFAMIAMDGLERVSGWTARGSRWKPAIFWSGAVAISAAFLVWTLPSLALVRTSDSPSWAAVEWLESQPSVVMPHLAVAFGMKPFAEYALRDVPLTQVLDIDAVPLAPVEPGTLLVGEGTDPNAVVRFDRQEYPLRKITRSHYYHISIVPWRERADFRAGWSAPDTETDPERPSRTMGGRSALMLPPSPGADSGWLKLGFTLEARSTVEIQWNGQRLEREELGRGGHQVIYEVPRSLQSDHNLLEIAVDGSGTGGSGELNLWQLCWGEHRR